MARAAEGGAPPRATLSAQETVLASLGHIAVGLAAGRLHAGPGASARATAIAMAGFIALSVAPDADVVSFVLGIPYAAPFGHRGASHSLAVAAACALLCGVAARALGARALRLGLFVFLVVASHGLLDTLTDGGLGVALAWPFSDARFFAPWRPIPVSPLGVGIVSARGLFVLVVELVYFAPLLAWALWPRRAALPARRI